MLTAMGCIVLLVPWWVAFWLPIRKAKYLYFDPQDILLDSPTGPNTLSRSAGTFEPFFLRYTDIAKLVINLAIGSIAVLSGYVSYIWQNKACKLSSVQLALGPSLILLAFSVMYAVFFLISLSWTYETYVSNYRSYTPFWAATVRSLALSGTTCFAVGYVWLALAIVTALGK